MKNLAHWDEVAARRREVGHLAGDWYDLGAAAGSVAVGVQRILVDGGKWSTPAHAEGAEEEIFYVLSGSGISWQDGEAYEVGESDCLVHLPEGQAHTLRAGPDGLDVLAYGSRRPQGNTVLPRAGVAWMSPSWVDVGGPHPWEREAAAGEPEVDEIAPRPSRIANLSEGIRYELPSGAVDRSLGDVVGSVETGLSHMTVPPGAEGYTPHCHSAEEELFVVLDGSGTVMLGDESAEVRRGSVVSRPAGSRVPHSFRAGDDGLAYLAYGTREPNDIVYEPRTDEIRFRGVGVRLPVLRGT
ncbi:MAG TPA: cupin domain-containing protein [Gaiellaceae bacterium]|nr:cupin domain-containing protein [Gaiellaceae bacterium]